MKETSRVTIHSGASETGVTEIHPLWRGEHDEEISVSPFDRSETEMREINERLQSILEGAPSDASAELMIRKTDEGFRGSLNIYSSHRQFSGRVIARHIKELIDRLIGDVRAQIDDWKRQRVVNVGDGL